MVIVPATGPPIFPASTPPVAVPKADVAVPEVDVLVAVYAVAVAAVDVLVEVEVKLVGAPEIGLGKGPVPVGTRLPPVFTLVGQLAVIHFSPLLD